MRGEDTFEDKPWDFLLGLESNKPNHFDSRDYGSGRIVGQSHRTSQGQTLIKHKSDGALILLVPEPGNQHDPNAIATLMAYSLNDHPSGQKWVWVHVGYVEKDVAAAWMTGWAHDDKGRLLTVEGQYLRYSSQLQKVRVHTKTRSFY